MPGRFISIFEKKGLIYQLDGLGMGTGDNPVKKMERYGKRKSVSVR